jgi:phycocyanobilin:ferredoxin oxidoreductase
LPSRWRQRTLPDGAARVPATTGRDPAARLAAWERRFLTELTAAPGAQALPPPDVPAHPPHLIWRNRLFATTLLRRGHVELFAVPDRFSVLHVCLMPRCCFTDPIFGLDIVAGRAVTSGFFLDLSPVGPVPETLGDLLRERPSAARGIARQRPVWGGIFSPAFVCEQPAGPGMAEAALTHGLILMQAYLRLPGTPGEGSPGQAAYCRGQQENDHTRRMLAGFVGEAAAERFLNSVLFPLPV